jgi:hypothetical protein
VNAPVVNTETERANFTNEGGVENTFRLLKNIAGLWLVQECRRALARAVTNGRDYGYDELTALAQAAPPLASVIDPDDPSLLAPADMPEAIRTLCRTTGEPEPSEVGPLIRCALDGLAMRYRWTLDTLERITGRPIHTLHIVGGGTQNTLLNNWPPTRRAGACWLARSRRRRSATCCFRRRRAAGSVRYPTCGNRARLVPRARVRSRGGRSRPLRSGVSRTLLAPAARKPLTIRGSDGKAGKKNGTPLRLYSR